MQNTCYLKKKMQYFSDRFFTGLTSAVYSTIDFNFLQVTDNNTVFFQLINNAEFQSMIFENN